MRSAKLKFKDREIEFGDGKQTLGRASDNNAAFSEDSNVSRYHAEIEKRGDEFWIVDLGSSNGTTVNGKKVDGEMLLQNGDKITLGGSSEIEIEFVESSKEDEKAEGKENGGSGVSLKDGSAGAIPSKVETGGAIERETKIASKMPLILIAAGVICGLAVICVAAAGIVYYTRTTAKCEAKAFITSPEPGETLIKATDIEVEIENGECAERAIFLMDGEEFARTEDKPFTATLDPKQFPDLSDGFEHNLQIVLEDEEGNKLVQPSSVPLAFETREIAKPSPTPEIAKTEEKTTTKTTAAGKQVSLIDIGEMSKRLVKQFGGNFSYNVSNKQFLAEVQKKTAEYAQEGYFERAAPFRDAINIAYVREQNLDAPLGFVLAMSRSKFVPAKQGNNEGLWQMTSDFVTANAYNGACGTETLSDASQICAAKASALYMKQIVYGVFDGDVIYSAAVFGKSPQDAGAWKATLPANRSDVWNAIKTALEREQLVRFFAAGIVAENPQKFGLKKDRPLSEHYRIVMGQ